MAYEQRDLALAHLLDRADPGGPMRFGNPAQSPATRDELGVAEVWLRPGPLLVELDLTGHIAGRQVDGVVSGEAHRDRRLDGAWRGAGDHWRPRPPSGTAYRASARRDRRAARRRPH